MSVNHCVIGEKTFKNILIGSGNLPGPSRNGPLLRGFFSRYSGFPSSTKPNISKFQFDLECKVTFERVPRELFGAPWVNKLHLLFLTCFVDCCVLNGIKIKTMGIVNELVKLTVNQQVVKDDI